MNKTKMLIDKSNQTKTIVAIFEEDLHAEIFLSRCQDTGEKPDLQKAKMFRQSYNKINSKKNTEILNLYSMRLGVNTIMKLISLLENRNHIKTLNLADNCISEYGMHAIKNLINSTKLHHLNLASNMISQIGLSLVLEELIKNTHIKTLDLGILEGSIRKNSFGIDGSRCLAAILLQNKTIQSLKLQDNDIGINGAEILSITLKRNKYLQDLKIAENLIKTQGAEYILMNALHIRSLDLGKNFIKSSIGPTLKKYIQTNNNLKKINMQFNELLAEGTKTVFEGVIDSNLQEISVKGNALGDRGLLLLSDIFSASQVVQSLKVLDLSRNQLTNEGIPYLKEVFSKLKLRTLCINHNILGDTGTTLLIQVISQSLTRQSIQKLQISSCKVSDKGFLILLQNINKMPEIHYIKCAENYISEKYQKIFIELLSKNQSLISLGLQGNRLSLSGIKGIKRIVDRNAHNFSQKEPNKIRSQIHNLREKQKRIKQAQDKIEKQRKQILKLQENKTKLQQAIIKMEKQDKQSKIQHEETVKAKLQQIQKFIQSNRSKLEELEQNKEQKALVVDQLSTQLQRLRQKRKQLQYQLSVTENESVMIEREFQRKIRQKNQ